MEAELRSRLEVERRRLEGAWGEETRYRNFTYLPRHPDSKGQCGVSSAYLFKILRGMDLQVAFCEGNAYFPDGIAPILDHCWLEVFGGPGTEIGAARNYIVDVTADQAEGFAGPILFMTREEALEQGIDYRNNDMPSRDMNVPPANANLLERVRVLLTNMRHISPSRHSGKPVLAGTGRNMLAS